VVRRYADADPRIRLVRGANGGVAAARNRGLAASDPRTEYVIFLDSDDVWEDDALQTLVSALEAHPEWSSVHALARCVDSEGSPMPDDDLTSRLRNRIQLRDGRVVSVAPEEPTTFGAMTCDNWVLTPGTHLIRRDVIARVGTFDEDTDPADDWDMAIRISRYGDMGFIDRPLLRWRRHANTLTNTSPRWRRAHFRVRTKTMIDPTNTAEQRRVARQAFAGTYRATARDALREARAGRYCPATRAAMRTAHQWVLYLRAALWLRLPRPGPRAPR
jgi:glycosyltransferase involved in cell wall biosynthesis